MVKSKKGVSDEAFLQQLRGDPKPKRSFAGGMIMSHPPIGSGKSLAELVQGYDEDPKEATKASSELQISKISPNPWQPRRKFDETKIQELARSISEVGLIQPVVVRSVGSPDTHATGESVGTPDTRYQIVAGERRYRAHRVLGKESIQAIVVDATDEQMAALALVENFSREDLSAYEIALSIRSSESAFPSRKSLAACLGINRTDLYQYLAFFKLPGFVLADLDANPDLLGRDAAEDVAKVLAEHGDKAARHLESFWVRLKAGDIEQGKIAGLIELAITRSGNAHAERDIRKLFVGNVQAGSITRDATGLSVKIKAAALTPEKETELREFVERLFADK